MSSTEDEILNAVLALHSRVGTVDGKVNLIARANRSAMLAELRKEVARQPQIGQIYLLLDGARAQKEIVAALAEYGIGSSEATVSRRLAEMADHGIADLVQGGKAKVYKKDREMERILSLSKNIRKWLAEDGKIVPEPGPRRRRKTT